MATNKPNFSRRVSEFSAATLDKLSTLEDEIGLFETQVEKLAMQLSDIGNSNTISKEVMDDLIASRNDLRQYVGNLEKFQFVKVDAIITADLQSGKEEARTRRKNLTARCEAVRTKQVEIIKRIDELVNSGSK
ncbi:hypothetical protein TrCOL_g6779 [Triparma columacea]|uniref:Uncharacterized protein n=1 Tax=Triparma columacea TaxID=722753 RepID=A0A9W7FYI1_9STRA|nr:hypothetical protein TrCOL_g6779 [Triparma columacea]